MNPKNILSLRWRTPRALALAGLMALVIVVTALALTQTSTVAAPPPPLRGPFHFTELPDKASAAKVSDGVQRVPIYTQTFGTGFYSDSHWNITNTTTLYDPPAPYMWGIVQQNEYATQSFTDTLWVKADAKQGIVYERYKLPSGATYTETMDTWAIYGPLDAQQYAYFQAQFSFYLDTDPGAHFGWATSADGTNFCGQSLSGHIQQWVTATFDLPTCPGQTGGPVYLAFFFQSDDSTPAGLGAFVDNLVISGMPLYKTYLPFVRKDPTPIASPTPTVPPYLVTQSYDFESGTGSTSRWCKANYTEWASNIISLGGSNAYYLAMKQAAYRWALSPRDSSADNFRITANFNLLRMNNSLSLYDYRGARFGLLFTVKGTPFDPNDSCSWNEGVGISSIGFYRFVIKIRDDGSGYQARIERWEGGVIPDADQPGWVDLPSGVTINRTGWNTMRIDRVGAGIQAYINDTLVQSWNNDKSGTGGWFGLFTETRDYNRSDYPFESDWDNITVYKLQ